MESTGKYWILFTIFWRLPAPSSWPIPDMLRLYGGKKTDKEDAKWIDDIFKHNLVSGSFIPPADIRQLRDLMRYHWKLTCLTTGEKNCAQNCLTVSNIKLDNVFSDVFGKATSAITVKLLENNELFDVTPYLTRRRFRPLWTGRCVLNRLKSSASSVLTWKPWNCTN